MSTNGIERGVIVVAPRQPELGPGKVLLVRNGKALVHFRDDPESKDKRTYSVDGGFLEIAASQSDDILDNLPEFKDGKFVSATSDPLTFRKGLDKFLGHFPGGFEDLNYLGIKAPGAKTSGERNYKIYAHELYQREIGDGRGERMLAEGQLEELANHVADIVTNDVNLLDPRFEAPAFAAALKLGGTPVAEFFSALFAFIDSGPEPKTFNALADALANLPTTGTSEITKWPALTVLPYIARPDDFMFLKPTATRKCADSLYFDLGYTSDLKWGTYDRLLTMSRYLLEKLQPHGARDFIDVQSYIWVVEKYRSEAQRPSIHD